MPVLNSTYRNLRARYLSVVEDRDEAVKLAAERLSTITRLAALVDDLRDAQPNGPVQQPRPASGNVELRRQLNLALRTIREQGLRLDELQASHVADTRELHDLRQGAAS
jgi:hypothetical protein